MYDLHGLVVYTSLVSPPIGELYSVITCVIEAIAMNVNVWRISMEQLQRDIFYMY